MAQLSIRPRGKKPSELQDPNSDVEARADQPLSPPDVSEQGSSGTNQDASLLQSRLAEAFRTEPGWHPANSETILPDFDIAEPDAVARQPDRRRKTPKWASRATKSIVGLALLVVAVWIPAQQLFQVASAEAVVNARLVTLRSPIAGEIFAADPQPAGDGQGRTLFEVINTRADATRVYDAVRAVAETVEERAELVVQIETLRSQQAELQTQLEAFRLSRIELLSALMQEPEEVLNARGRSHNEIAIELAALERGLFIGDAYNDRPSSAQRLDFIALEIASLETRLAVNEAQHARLVEAEARERAWFELVSRAAIVSPASGIVWELLTAPGEQVAAGQELVRMVDCAQTVVTAAVSEAVYNQLVPGMEAMFTFREGGDPLPGRVAQLTGIASASANLAITPSDLRAESYRVVVDVPGLAGGDGCALGRTGKVVFNTTGAAR
jgi:multidrug resistance efflux pump